MPDEPTHEHERDDAIDESRSSDSTGDHNPEPGDESDGQRSAWRWVKSTSAAASGALGTAGRATKDAVISAGETVRQKTAGAAGAVQRSRAGQTVSSASKRASEHFDTLSGAAILRLVEERLEVQARYNDLLATKLDEALRRIETLERQLHRDDR